MKIQTFSIVAGSMACNGRCPFCIAGMTPESGVTAQEPTVNWFKFEKACLLAKQSGATTAMITSKGEPTLFPNQIKKFLQELVQYNFPIIELQTNAIKFHEDNRKYKEFLVEWYELGLTTIAISIVHYLPEKNRQVYLPYKDQYIDLPTIIGKLHEIGYSVRLTCIAAKDYIDSEMELDILIKWAKMNNVEQLTVTPVNATEHMDPDPQYQKTKQWAEEHKLPPHKRMELLNYLNVNGTMIRKLVHGAIVFDVKGQNVCLSNCLTVEPESEELRNIIFFPDGHVRTHWQYEGSIIF